MVVVCLPLSSVVVIVLVQQSAGALHIGSLEFTKSRLPFRVVIFGFIS